MKTKYFLVSMTLIAVLSDAMLLPFYPQFFDKVFQVTDPRQVGCYFSAICFTVMIAFPFWAYIAKRIAELKLLVYTQFIAGLLALYCFFTTSYIQFWIISLLMIVFKGSYLLVYPYILRLERKEHHGDTIGLLSVIVHFGNITGAVLGGMVSSFLDPLYIFLLMAGGDFIQMFVSLYLLKTLPDESLPVNKAKAHEQSSLIPKGFVVKLGIVTLIFYFSLFIVCPFFSRYWETISIYNNRIVSGFVYAIPGVVALFALFINRKTKEKNRNHFRIMFLLLTGAIALFFQASGVDSIIVVSRFIYGWTNFHAVVYFDLLLFHLSTPSSYATDYSKIHFFQNLGVLLASLIAGIIVHEHGLQMPFLIAILGFIMSLGLFYYAFLRDRMFKNNL